MLGYRGVAGELGQLDQGQATTAEEGGGVEADAGDEQLGQTKLQALDTLHAGVERDRARVVAAGENLARQRGTDAARAEFEEYAHTGVVHRLDFGNELDRLKQVRVELLLYRRRRPRIGLAIAVGEHGELRRDEAGRVDRL